MIPIEGVVIIIVILLEELLIDEDAPQAVLVLMDRDLAGGNVRGATHEVGKPGEKPPRDAMSSVPGPSCQGLPREEPGRGASLPGPSVICPSPPPRHALLPHPTGLPHLLS